MQLVIQNMTQAVIKLSSAGDNTRSSIQHLWIHGLRKGDEHGHGTHYLTLLTYFHIMHLANHSDYHSLL